MRAILAAALMIATLGAPSLGSEQAKEIADQGAAMALALSELCEDADFEAFAADYIDRLYEAAGATPEEAKARIEALVQQMNAPMEPGNQAGCDFFAKGMRHGEAGAIAKIKAAASAE